MNPNLGFWPVLYYGDIVGTESVFTGTTNYCDLFDGVIFPYRDDPNHDTSVTATASQIEAVHAAISDKHNLPTVTHAYEIRYPWGQPSSAGWYGQAAQTVTVPSAPSYSVTVRVSDDFTAGTAGYHFKQLLVASTVVWEEDMSGGDEGWHLVTKDLTPYLSAGTHTIKFRVYDKKGVSNFGVNAWFDDITTQRFTLADTDFEGVNSQWSFSQNGTPWTSDVARTMENLPLVVMVYASQLYCGSTPGYVNTVASTTLDLASQGYADGVITYAMNKTGQDATDANGNITSYAVVYDKIQALYGSWLPAQTQQGRIIFVSGTPSAPRYYGQIAQTIAVTPGQNDYTMGFWLKDDFTATTAGYHFKQLLVNGVVVWEENVAYDEARLDQGFNSSNPPGWQYVYVDLTQQLQG